MVKKLTASAVVLGLMVGLALMAANRAKADSNQARFIYSVKFTCGQQSTATTGSGDDGKGDADVVTGVYRTNINVHNPQYNTVNFKTKIVLPDNASPNGITPLVSWTLNSDHSLFIDCYTTETLSGVEPSIAGQLGADGITAPTGEFEGFVVIESPKALDVIGKYTARSGAGQFNNSDDVSSLQVVVYQPSLAGGD